MSRPLGALAILVLLACGCGRSYEMAKRDRDIEQAARAVAAARTDPERAQAYGARGRAYSEKARYGSHIKAISPPEYARIFDLAIEDHDQAIVIAPADAHGYLSRGLTYYDRASLEMTAAAAAGATGVPDSARRALEAAQADFTNAIERDGRNVQALDYRGLVNTSLDRHDEAIADFAREMELDAKMGRLRLADAYCRRGSSLHRTKPEAAIDDYEKALDLGGSSDACECQPENPLVTLYYEKGDYDRAWAAVKKANASHRAIAPEILEPLKKASGRTQ